MYNSFINKRFSQALRMIWLRKRWTSRLLAAVFALSMVPTLIVPAGRAAGGAQFGSYEQWIRTQLRIPADAAVEKAISVALESNAKSFDSFIVAFLEAYAEAAPQRPVSQVFTQRNLSDDALISFLQRRYSQVADEGVLPRVYLTSVMQGLAHSGVDKSGLSEGSISRQYAAPLHLLSALPSTVEKVVVIPFRTISSARPLGP